VIKQLEANPNLYHVTDKSITYSFAFKLKAVKAYTEGLTPMEIFMEAGFGLKRWRATFATHGETGLLEERPGKGSSGRPIAGELSTEEKLKRAQARIKLLEAENDFLKKLEALERQKSE
jgi:transposase-like protein